MSLNKSAIRLSLLAGSSMAAILAASPASAANECGNPSASGAAADVLACPPGTYLTGIDYSTTSDGDLTVVLRDRVDTGTSNTAGTGGIRLFGKTGENMSLIREDTPSVVGDPRIVNTAGRGIDVTTQGDGHVLVNLTDGDPAAGEPTTPAATAPAPLRLTGGTDAIRAEAAGTGNVTVTIAETGAPSGANHPRAIVTAGANVGSNGSGIVARTTSGAINIDTRGAQFTINGTNGGGSIDAQSASGSIGIAANQASGRLFGIRAQTGGTGTLAISVANGASSTAVNSTGIETIAGTGLTTINLTGGGINSGNGLAIRAVSASTLATAVNIQNTGAGQINGRLDFSGVTGGGVVFNNTLGSWTTSGTNTFTGFNDTITFAANHVRTAAGTAINFGAGNDSFTAGGGTSELLAGTAIDFGTGNDTFTLGGRSRPVTTTFSFGAGTDTMNLSGVMAMDGLTITGLETLNNSAVILMGGGTIAPTNFAEVDYVTSDAAANDVLRMDSGTFNGTGASRLLMDVLLGGESSQAGCATLTGAGDCLDLRGASTAGSTLVILNHIGAAAALGGYNPIGITLVDVGGAGTSAAGHFALDPGTAGYRVDRTFGAVAVRPGLIGYALRYDAANQRHVLVGLPRSEALEYAILTGAAHSIWHMTSETVTDRQADLRDGAEADSLWLRASGEYTRRTVATPFETFGATFAVDNSYKLYAGTIMGGMDLVTGERGGYEYVVGLQAGYVASSFDLDATETSGRFAGATGGAYASVWSDWFFLDGTLNINGLTLDFDQPGLNARTTTFLNSVGLHAESGIRTSLTERAFVEPMVTLSYVRTSFEEISLSGGEIKPADAKSLRGALGVRLGGTLGGEGASATYFLTGRAWNEFDGEGGGTIVNPGADLPFTDEFSGAFGETEVGVNVFNAANTLSGFATSGVKFKKDYSAVNLSLGVRMAW